ncbi:MAG: BsuPI-related putative proteinase inhibitor [Halorubrum sp.]|uniref:BsuPI-related putative proteinase inhibitor n=1 Tax=Halorubrum sp. TaxID=1879286 RepID=UPI0039704DD7
MLDAALTAADGDDGVDFALTVTNEGDEPVTLRFRTGQRADFAAYEGVDDDARDADGDAPFRDADGDAPFRDADGDAPDTDPVWRHGAGQLFTQALGSETLEPDESSTYEGTWRDPPAGEYLVVGWLTADDHDASATARVAVD